MKPPAGNESVLDDSGILVYIHTRAKHTHSQELHKYTHVDLGNYIQGCLDMRMIRAQFFYIQISGFIPQFNDQLTYVSMSLQ